MVKSLKILAFFLILFIVGELIYFSYVKSWQETSFTEEVVIRSDQYETLPPKRLWDWMDLLVIPVALGLIAYFLYRSEKRRQELMALKKLRMEMSMADERSQELALTKYFEKMTELILERDLKNADEDSDVNIVAKTLTHVLLIRLNKRRKAMVVKYLYKTGLLTLMKR